MPSSTLTPDNFPAGRDRSVLKGHGTFALGPSDSSDSGSDLQGLAGPDIGTDRIDYIPEADLDPEADPDDEDPRK